jgi:hypothetical protein
VAARRLRIDRMLLDSASPVRAEAMDLILVSVLDTTRCEIENLRKAVQDGVIELAETTPPQRKLFVAKTLSRLTAEQARAFHQRLKDLTVEFTEQMGENPDEPGYNLTILMHPLQLTPPDEGERET